MQTVLTDIQAWYAAQCDGDWEHGFGIKISTLDNPGWSVKINLAGTLLEEKSFIPITNSENEEFWIFCEVKDGDFVGAGDPTRLEEMLSIFLEWAKSEPDWLAVEVESATESEERRDRKFWLALKEEPGTEKCRKSDCDRPKLHNSVFCRQHHFEMIKKKPPPTEE